MNNKIVFIDTETGGLEPTINSLLSVALVIWHDFEIIDSFEVLINDGKLNATAEALKINGIDLVEHKKNGLNPEKAILRINQFLAKHFDEAEKITLAGHNVNFDINFFKFFLSQNNFSFHKRFSHRVVDTATILYYLYIAGKIKQKSISSSEAFKLFGIDVDNRHTAIGDAIATAKLFSLLLKTIVKSTRIQHHLKNQPGLFD